MNKLTIGAAIALVVCGGCSTKVIVEDISATDSKVTGIPFRALEPHVVRVYAKDPATSMYKEVFAKPFDLANPDKLYSLNYSADYFANPSFEIAFQNDNTLKTVNVSDQSHLAQALKDLSATATSVSTAIADSDLNKIKAKKERLTAETEILNSEVSLAKARAGMPEYQETTNTNQEAKLENALKMKNLAEVAERELATTAQKQDATANDIANAEAKVQITRLQANQAYRRAGLPEPYPGVFP